MAADPDIYGIAVKSCASQQFGAKILFCEILLVGVTESHVLRKFAARYDATPFTPRKKAHAKKVERVKKGGTTQSNRPLLNAYLLVAGSTLLQ